MKEDLGVVGLHKFVITVYDKDKKKVGTIEPWAGKEAELTEWMRNDSALTSRRLRTEPANFVEVVRDSRVYINDSWIQDKVQDIAKFASSVDGDIFEVAARLVPENIKPHDRVKLHILGCCSIVDVEKVQE